MGRKKILQVIERFDVAGAEIVIRDLVLNLPSSEWDVEVCVLEDIGRLGRELKEIGYPIHYLDWRKDNASEITIISRLKALLKTRQVDLLHAHNSSAWYFSIFASFLSGIKSCVTLHGFIRGTDTFRWKTMYALLSRLTDNIVIVSDSIKDQLKTIPLFDLKKVKTIINGVDSRVSESFDKTEKRRSLGLSEDDFVLGTVGRFYPEKNIEMQIRLVHALAPEIPNLKLVVVAERYGDYEPIEKLVREMNIEDRVIFTGLRRDVSELLKIFDIFIMTSFTEGTSLALLEAISSGVTSVVSDVGGNSRIITHEDNGILFDVHNPESFRNNISELYYNHEKRQRLAHSAEKCGQKYTLANMILAYDNLYKSMLSHTTVSELKTS